jgi:protein SCO1
VTAVDSLAQGDEPGIAGRFDLLDHYGAPADAYRFRGRFVLVFFGFTHCKVVCPRALGKLDRVVSSLGARTASVQALYITVDPRRDTAAVLRGFLCEKYPTFLGLTGSEEQIAAARSAFRVFATVKQTADGDYAVPHTAITYVLGPDGALADHWPDSLSEDTMAKRLSALLDGWTRTPAVGTVP